MLKILSNTLFPPVCIHCSARTESNKLLFCKGCQGFFELIDPLSRCCYCFAEKGDRRPCFECVNKKRWGVKMASAFDYLGPVSSLVKKLKYGRMPYLAKTGSAFMLIQFFRLNWPVPDLIVPVPRRVWFQGVNHAYLLAQNLAKRLQLRCVDLLKRDAANFSQARLDRDQREKLLSTSFRLKKNAAIEDKIILLIDDVITTGSTVRGCAETLQSGFPAKIFALSVARTL